MSEDEVTMAFYLYPVGNAIFTIMTGFISDKWGRRPSAITMTSVAIIAYALFFAGSLVSFPPMVGNCFRYKRLER